MKLPSLLSVIKSAHRMGAVSNRFRVGPDEVKRIRAAEKAGGHDQGLKVVLEILRERNRAR